MEPEEILHLLEGGGGIVHGHFLRRPDSHATLLVRRYLGAHDPGATERLCGELLRRFQEESFDVVVVRASLEDILLGYVCGRSLGVPLYWVSNEEGVVRLLPPEPMSPGARALVVGDVFSSGATVKEMMAVLESQGAVLKAIGALVGEELETWFPQLHTEVLLSLQEYTHPPEGCPLCLSGVPLAVGR